MAVSYNVNETTCVSVCNLMNSAATAGPPATSRSTWSAAVQGFPERVVRMASSNRSSTLFFVLGSTAGDAWVALWNIGSTMPEWSTSVVTSQTPGVPYGDRRVAITTAVSTDPESPADAGIVVAGTLTSLDLSTAGEQRAIVAHILNSGQLKWARVLPLLPRVNWTDCSVRAIVMESVWWVWDTSRPKNVVVQTLQCTARWHQSAYWVHLVESATGRVFKTSQPITGHGAALQVALSNPEVLILQQFCSDLGINAYTCYGNVLWYRLFELAADRGSNQTFTLAESPTRSTIAVSFSVNGTPPVGGWTWTKCKDVGHGLQWDDNRLDTLIEAAWHSAIIPERVA
eukprot:m51a1_g4806 hypothetical protein (343) ;mRNA; f:124806-127881